MVKMQVQRGYQRWEIRKLSSKPKARGWELHLLVIKGDQELLLCLLKLDMVALIDLRLELLGFQEALDFLTKTH